VLLVAHLARLARLARKAVSAGFWWCIRHTARNVGRCRLSLIVVAEHPRPLLLAEHLQLDGPAHGGADHDIIEIKLGHQAVIQVPNPAPGSGRQIEASKRIIGRPRQLAGVIFGHLKYPLNPRTKPGRNAPKAGRNPDEPRTNLSKKGKNRQRGLY
jgi:hypothetical protein